MKKKMLSKTEPFSVLISIYFKENTEYLSTALNSIWDRQTLKPSEIIIVKDGLLTEELDSVIDDFKKEAPVKVVVLEKNVGLGVALAKGLEQCSHEIVARMDGDDISVPERFEKQISFLSDNSDIAFTSSNIAEFHENIELISGIREVPKTSDSIITFAKKRNPMNHMAVAFRKSAVLDVGNYITFHGYEDYYLWVRLLLKGYKGSNLNENLIYARVGNNMLSRRQGIKFFKQELKLQNQFYSLKFINKIEFIRNLCLRAIPRLMPIWALTLVYKKLRK